MADAAYGLWPLVVLNTGLFVLLAVSFVPGRRPQTVQHDRQPSRRSR